MSHGSLVIVFALVGLGWWQGSMVPPRPAIRRLYRSTARPLRLAFAGLVIVAAGAALTLWPLATAVVAGAALGARRAARRSREARAQAAAVAALPQALELCIVTLGAGGTIADCLRTVGEHGPEPARAAAATALRAHEDGLLLDAALRSFQARLGPTFQPLSGALRLAWERGGAVSALLDRLAIEASLSRRRSGELRARRLPVLLLVPLVGFSLPAVVLGAVVPLALVGLRQVS